MSSSNQLPEIPEKRYFTISEASELCGVKPHVLRYWEQEFPQLNPATRRGNRRYYQHKDIIMIRQIRTLLYEEGFTISGARQQLYGIKKPLTTLVEDQRQFLDEICNDLQVVLSRISVTKI